MQRGPRRTHTGQGETQGLQAGSEGTGCSGRAAGPPCSPSPPKLPPAPHFLYTESPHGPAALSPLGSEGKGRVQESGEMRRGPIPDTTPAQQDPTPAGGGSVAEPAARGRLSITGPPTQPQVGLGLCNPAAGGCPANPSHRTRGGGGGGSLGCARPQHMASARHQLPGRASHCRHLPPNSPRSAGRGWAHRGGDE